MRLQHVENQRRIRRRSQLSSSGSVVPLESLVGDPVNVFVNDRLVAHGEVLVVNENFAVRITEVIPLPKAEK